MHNAQIMSQSRSQERLPARQVVPGRVSVIIPAYNAAATVERTIASVLNQSYTNLEVLVVDDGSTDETAALVQQMVDVAGRIRLLQKPNGGLVSARNHGIAHATGEFIAPVDADDLWHPQKIAKQVALMRKRGDQVGLIYTWGRGIDEDDRILKDLRTYRFRGDVYAALIVRGFVGSGAPLVRRRCVDEVGGYDASLSVRGATCCEDFKFSLDIAERCHFDLVPEFLWGYRFRSGSMSTHLENMVRSHELVLRDVRPRHPELPSKLFRWGRADQYMEYALYHLRDARFWQAGQLFLKALRDDPPGTLLSGVRQVAARLERARSLGVSTIDGDEDAIFGRKFLEVDPTVFGGRPRRQLSHRRMAYVSEIQVQAVATPRLSACDRM